MNRFCPGPKIRAATGASRTTQRAKGPSQIGCHQTGSATTPQNPVRLFRHQLTKLDRDALCAEFPILSLSSAVHGLVVLLDSELTLSHHIDQVCRRCYVEASACSLALKAAVSLIHAFVS